MSLDPSSIESDLTNLRPARLDEALLTRLDACADQSWTQLHPGELQIESRLRKIAPAHLPPGLMASLEAVVSAVPFPRDEKIVVFPKLERPLRKPHRNWWGAVAAVAITGAVTALLIPTAKPPDRVAVIPPRTSAPPPSSSSSNLVPAGFNRGLSEASDEGVIWQSNDQPHQVVKVVYMDHLTLKDADGRTYQVEQPRVEYILVPAKTD
jgi:hypothetical protein